MKERPDVGTRRPRRGLGDPHEIDVRECDQEVVAAVSELIARIALRDPGLPRLRPDPLSEDLKLLVDPRDQVVCEQTRVRNRLHALLMVMAPGYREMGGALTGPHALDTARSLVLHAIPRDRVRARVALRAIGRLDALAGEAKELEEEIAAMLQGARAGNLLSLCGVGLLVAAKIMGETGDVSRFPSKAAFASYAGAAPIPASSGTVVRHRLNRGGNRQLNRALFTMAVTQARWDPMGRAFLAKKRAEGNSAEEARRALKRHLANAVYHAMTKDKEEATPSLTMVG